MQRKRCCISWLKSCAVKTHLYRQYLVINSQHASVVSSRRSGYLFYCQLLYCIRPVDTCSQIPHIAPTAGTQRRRCRTNSRFLGPYRGLNVWNSAPCRVFSNGLRGMAMFILAVPSKLRYLAASCQRLPWVWSSSWLGGIVKGKAIFFPYE